MKKILIAAMMFLAAQASASTISITPVEALALKVVDKPCTFVSTQYYMTYEGADALLHKTFKMSAEGYTFVENTVGLYYLTTFTSISESKMNYMLTFLSNKKAENGKYPAYTCTIRS